MPSAMAARCSGHDRVDRAAADDGYVGDEDWAGELEERLEGDVWR